MARRSLILALALSLCATSMLAAGRRRAVRSTPEGPCRVRGLASIYYSTDGGTTWSGNAETPSRAASSALAVIEGTPETILTLVGTKLFASTDAGCNWTMQYTITEDIHHKPYLVPANEGRAYLWWEEVAMRYDGGVVTKLSIPKAIGGLGVNPANRNHVRVVDLSGGITRESFDGGMTWRQIGQIPGAPVINSAAFDPSDFNHIVVGMQARGILITRNGGGSWTNGAQAAFVCDLAFVPSQPNVVWATIPTGTSVKFVQRSTNGGMTLEPVAGVATVPSGVCLDLQLNPHDANRAVVVLDQFFMFDAVQKSVTPWTCCGGRAARMTWAPKEPARLYLSEAMR